MSTGDKGKEKSLGQSENMFKRLFDNTADALFLHDLDGRFVEVNQTACDSLGFTREALLHLHFSSIVKNVKPKSLSDLWARVIQGAKLTVQGFHQRRDGSTFPVEVHLSSFEYKGHPHILASARDITERREAEKAIQDSVEKCRRLQANIPGMVYLFALHPDGSYSFPYANAASRELFDIAPEDLMRDGALLTELIHPDDRERRDKAIRHSAATLQPFREELRHIVNGKVRWYDWMSRPEPQPNGDILWDSIMLEITDRKRTEEALRTSESFLNSIIDQSPYPMWISDDRGTLIKLNQACRNLLNITDAEVVGKYNILQDNIIEEQGLLPQVRLVFEKGEAVRYEIKYDSSQVKHLQLRQTASVILDVTMFPIKDTNGRITNAVVQHIDITDRKWAETALAESEQRFSTFMDHLPAAAFIKDQNGRLLFANRYLRETLGWEDCLRKTTEELLPPEIATRMIEDDRRVLTTGPEVIQERITDVQGVEHFFDTYKFPIMVEGSSVLVGGIAVDVTDRKRAEEALTKEQLLTEAILDSLPGTFFLLDSQGRQLRTNRSAIEITGYSWEELSNMYALESIAEEDRPAAQRAMEEVLKIGEASLEKSMLTKDGRRIPFLFHAKKFIIDDIPHILGTGLDITARMQAEEALRESEKKYHSLYQEFQGILNAIPDILCLLSPDLRIVWGNEATILGIPGKQQLDIIGKHCYPLRHERSEPCEKCPVVRSFSSGKMETEEVVSYGNIYELRAVPLYDDQGGLRGAIEVARNITARKLMEEALRKSEEQLRLALQAAKQGLYDLNIQTGEANVSPEYATMLGFDPGEFQETNARWIERLHPDDREQVAATYQAYIQGKIPDYSVEFRQSTQSGDWKWILSLGKIVAWDEDGKPLRMLGTHTDITERKRSEEALRNSEITYREIFNTVSETIWIHGIETWEFLDVNNNVEEMFGYSVREALNLNVEDLSSGIPPFIKETAVELLKKAAAGEPQVFEWHCKHKDGHLFWSEVNLKRGTIAGKDCLLALERDITQRKKAEEALRESQALYYDLVETAQDLIWQCDLEGRYTYLNPAWEEVFGYKIDEMLGKRFADFQPPDYAARDLHEFTRLLEGNIIKGLETVHLAKDGKKLHLVFNAKFVRDQDGNIAGTRGTAYNITQRKQAEEEQAKLEAQMREVQKLESLGVLAGGIAHDFNNLLMGILGNADLALLALSPESPAHLNVEDIVRASQRAADLCRQMLAYSGKGRFVVGRYDLSEIVREMAQMLEVSISKKAGLRYSFGAELPPVEADATQLRQVIMNLITNASEALGDASGVISVTTGVMDCDQDYLSQSYLDDKLPEGRYVYLEVADTGTGMDEETRRRIFDPFFTTKFTGRGLGLAAVLGIVRGHKGAIKVYSEPGGGTTFKVLLPAGEWVRGERVPGEAQGTQPLPSGTILIIDDATEVRNVGRKMLERLGYKVLTAACGREGLEVFRESGEKITCVLLDLTMPEMSGDEVFRELRRLRSDLCVILSSGYNEQDVIQQFAGKGLAGFIQKPYTVAKLRETLQYILGQK